MNAANVKPIRSAGGHRPFGFPVEREPPRARWVGLARGVAMLRDRVDESCRGACDVAALGEQNARIGLSRGPLIAFGFASSWTTRCTMLTPTPIVRAIF